ncbi:MAG: hypothetical protein LBM16_00235 [Clostridiales bacterium]|jgi:hypothetical protein|nr:hypothetical protein [Clostridiales bacterium]
MEDNEIIDEDTPPTEEVNAQEQVNEQKLSREELIEMLLLSEKERQKLQAVIDEINKNRLQNYPKFSDVAAEKHADEFEIIKNFFKNKNTAV